MHSDNVRQLYTALQVEANVAAFQTWKVDKLVAKYLFKKDHIAKQHIVSQIRDSNHFIYGTDGTTRSKKH